jgi:hypothetical protein
VSKQVGDYYATAPTAYREHYIRDAQGNIMATYRYTNTGTASLKLNERPVYGSSRLGSLRKEVELHTLSAFDPATANPVQQVDLNYELTDHLGNVCAVVTGRLLDGNGGGTAKQAELVSAQGYEPFGSLLPGRNYSSDAYRFGFNTQEKDDEIYGSNGTSYAAQFWQYDPRIGRRWNIDPVNPAWNSSYAVFFNSPILYVDHNGLSPKKRAEKYAKKNELKDFTITEVKGRAYLTWNSGTTVETFSANSKKFGLNFGEWLLSFTKNLSGGRYSGGMGDNGAERHWSRFSDWHVDLSWVAALYELLSASTNTRAKRTDSSGNKTNASLRGRQRTETDNTALSHETKPGQGVSSGFSESSAVPKENTTVLQIPTEATTESEVQRSANIIHAPVNQGPIPDVITSFGRNDTIWMDVTMTDGTHRYYMRVGTTKTAISREDFTREGSR